MASFMKMVEKDMHHYILAALLAVFIVSDMSVPHVLNELIDTLLGKILVIGGALALLFAHPLLGALGLIAAYRLIRNSEQSHVYTAFGAPAVVPRATRGERVKLRNLTAMNQFPPTVEEEVIRKMLPSAPRNLSPPKFKPVLGKLYDAARVNA